MSTPYTCCTRNYQVSWLKDGFATLCAHRQNVLSQLTKAVVRTQIVDDLWSIISKFRTHQSFTAAQVWIQTAECLQPHFAGLSHMPLSLLVVIVALLQLLDACHVVEVAYWNRIVATMNTMYPPPSCSRACPFARGDKTQALCDAVFEVKLVDGVEALFLRQASQFDEPAHLNHEENPIYDAARIMSTSPIECKTFEPVAVVEKPLTLADAELAIQLEQNLRKIRLAFINRMVTPDRKCLLTTFAEEDNRKQQAEARILKAQSLCVKPGGVVAIPPWMIDDRPWLPALHTQETLNELYCPDSFLFCLLCKVSCNGGLSRKEHVQGSAHQKACSSKCVPIDVNCFIPLANATPEFIMQSNENFLEYVAQTQVAGKRGAVDNWEWVEGQALPWILPDHKLTRQSVIFCLHCNEKLSSASFATHLVTAHVSQQLREEVFCLNITGMQDAAVTRMIEIATGEPQSKRKPVRKNE